MEKQIETNSFKAWILAARPKTLAACVVPVLIGTGLAVMNDSFKLVPTLVCFIFAFLMQIAANFINDLYDFLKGSDRNEDRLGPERATAQGWITPKAMKIGIVITCILACVVGCILLLYAGHNWWKLVIIGALCVIFAFLYTIKLSYNGCGDILVLVFFGFVPVGGTYYVQAMNYTTEVFIASLVSGLVVDTLLVLNNYRDRVQDAVSGKHTLIVRFGEQFGRKLYLFLGLFASWMCLCFAFGGHLWAAILPQLYLLPHISTWNTMVNINSGKKLNKVLGMTSRNMLIMSLLLFIGMILK